MLGELGLSQKTLEDYDKAGIIVRKNESGAVTIIGPGDLKKQETSSLKENNPVDKG